MITDITDRQAGIINCNRGGRIYLTGATTDVVAARQEIAAVLAKVQGREHG